jgi:glycosyltransferase involved in cell wall biosynthesis
MMHIGIDARFLGPKQGGIGRYVLELTQTLAREHSSAICVTLLVKTGTPLPFAIPKHWRVVYTDIHWYGWAEQWLLPAIYKKIGADLWHFPHWNVPMFPRVPFVLTFHDAIMFTHPRAAGSTRGVFVYAVKYVLAYVVAFVALHRARHVIATSDVVRCDALRFFGVRSKKVTVVYQAPSHIPEALPMSPEPYSYALCVGAAFPHKNVSALVRAWHEALPLLPPNARLVLCGPQHVFYDSLRAAALPFDHVDIRQSVNDETLATLYAHAHICVQPSLAEGFGIPPLEACERGVPVLVNDIPVFHEILGDAVLFADASTPRVFAAAIAQLWYDHALRGQCRVRGPVQAARYSWSLCAEQTLGIYKNAGM